MHFLYFFPISFPGLLCSFFPLKCTSWSSCLEHKNHYTTHQRHQGNLSDHPTHSFPENRLALIHLYKKMEKKNPCCSHNTVQNMNLCQVNPGYCPPPTKITNSLACLLPFATFCGCLPWTHWPEKGSFVSVKVTGPWNSFFSKLFILVAKYQIFLAFIAGDQPNWRIIIQELRKIQKLELALAIHMGIRRKHNKNWFGLCKWCYFSLHIFVIFNSMVQ